MRRLNNLEFEINNRIEELIVKHGPMSVHDPRVARLFKNLAAIQKLKQSSYQPPDQDSLVRCDGEI